MKFDTITIDRQDAIWLVTLNRPERLNAMSQKMLLEMDSVSYTHLTLPTKRIV